MKKLLLLSLLAAIALPTAAAPKTKSPAPKVRWEYAFVEADAQRLDSPGIPNSPRTSGVQLFVPRRAPVFCLMCAKPFFYSEMKEPFFCSTFLIDWAIKAGN